jgi:regulator of sirC expression with transglutaminase-like and TPR domain
VDPRDRFAELVAGPEASIPLDEAALAIAATAQPGLDVASYLGKLDALAAGCRTPTLDGLIAHLFRRDGFTGDATAYYDPRNSFLNHVLDRRKGIPITLSIVTMEIGRRLGVPTAGVGLPGHFLLRDKVDPTVFVDPYNHGRLLDAQDCERLWRQQAGGQGEFSDDWLDPVGKWSILARVLGNLKAIYTAHRDLAALRWVMALRCSIPGVDEHQEFARLMGPLN